MKTTSYFLILLFFASVFLSCEKEKEQAANELIISNLKQSVDPPDPPGGGEPCGSVAAQQSASNCNLSSFSNNDFNNMYFVRDSMFTYSSKGQSYISNYYSISEFIVENGLFDNCENFENNFYQAYLDGFSMITKFINPFYTDTLITNSLYSKLMDVSTNLRNQDSTNQITRILDGLENDLNYLKN